jgi:hypothetical protein
MPPTKELTAEELERRRAKKNERNRRYYNNHKCDINSKRIQLYDPEKKREYYYGNHDRVLSSQREHYKLKKDSEKKERLNALLPLIADDEGLKKLIATHLENIDEIRLCEIATLERSVLLAVNK